MTPIIDMQFLTSVILHCPEYERSSDTEGFMAFTGPKIQQDLRNQTNRIPQQGDLRTRKLKRDQEQTRAQTPGPGMPRETPRSIGTGPRAVPKTARISSAHLTRSLCPCHPTVTKHPGCPGHVNIAHTSITPESR